MSYRTRFYVIFYKACVYISSLYLFEQFTQNVSCFTENYISRKSLRRWFCIDGLLLFLLLDIHLILFLKSKGFGSLIFWPISEECVGNRNRRHKPSRSDDKLTYDFCQETRYNVCELPMIKRNKTLIVVRYRLYHFYMSIDHTKRLE